MRTVRWQLSFHAPLYTGVFCSLLASSMLVPQLYAQDLPPPPRSYAEINPLFKLHLELIVNQYSTQQVIPVVVKHDEYFIEKSKLASLQIELPEAVLATESSLTDLDILTLGFASQATDWIALSQLDELKFDYQSATQTFHLDVPASWMPTQMLGRDTWYNAVTAQSGTGLLNNYDLYTQRSDKGHINSSLFTEQRFFSPYGVLKNSGIVTYTDQSTGDNSNNGYRRYDTTWQYDHPEKALSFALGDIFTGSKNTWGSAVRIGGLQIQRNFSTRPDLITYPLPQFNGQAALPSTVDLIINGQKVNSAEVQSGPFVLNNVPFINGKGEAVIVTTDSVGRQVVTAVPFYISNDLLKKGLFDYSLSLGQIREDYGIRDFAYGKFVGSADWRYGVNDWLTAEGRTEFADAIQLLGFGGVFKMKNWGVWSGSISQSWADQTFDHFISDNRTGKQYTLAYSYHQNRFGMGINHAQRDRSFTDLSHLQMGNIASVNSNSQRSTVINSYFSADKFGTLGVAYMQTKSNDIENKLMNLSWAPILPPSLQGITMSLSANHDFIEKDWSAAFQLSIPLSRKSATVGMGYQQQTGGDSVYVNYNRPVPSQGGFGIDLTQRFNENADHFSQARLSYRNRYLNSEIGVAGAEDYRYWLGVSGSLVWMAQSLFASNRLGESFALIDTNKVPDVPVQYENSLMGHSNRNGHIFVPSVTPYYAAKYSIDPINLPSNYNATQVEKRVAVKQGSGIVIQFPVKKSLAANVYLLYKQQPIPVGAVVHRAEHESSYVGLDGIAYLEDLADNNTIQVQLPDRTLCRASFRLDSQQAQQQIATIKSVICHEVVQP